MSKEKVEVDCEYKDICASYGIKCSTCRRNKLAKKDYYIPITSDTISWGAWYEDLDGAYTIHLR